MKNLFSTKLLLLFHRHTCMPTSTIYYTCTETLTIEKFLSVAYSCNNISNSVPTLEANNLSADREIYSHLWKSKLHFRVHMSLSLVPTLNYFNPARSFTYYFLKIYYNSHPHSNLNLRDIFSVCFPTKMMYAFLTPSMRATCFRQYHPPWFGYLGENKSLSSSPPFSPASCYNLPLTFEYSLLQPLVKHPQCMFFLLCSRPRITPVQSKQFYTSAYSSQRS
jgi:hypothetical protein